MDSALQSYPGLIGVQVAEIGRLSNIRKRESYVGPGIVGQVRIPTDFSINDNVSFER